MRTTSSVTAKATSSRAGGRIETSRRDRRDRRCDTRGDTPLRIKDVADVSIGRELRTGSASVNGREVVLGTALMLIGGNSRTVAAAADAKIEEINRRCRRAFARKTVLNRTQLVDATIHDRGDEPRRKARCSSSSFCSLLLGNFRAALITALVIPVDDAADRDRHAAEPGSAPT